MCGVHRDRPMKAITNGKAEPSSGQAVFDDDDDLAFTATPFALEDVSIAYCFRNRPSARGENRLGLRLCAKAEGWLAQNSNKPDLIR